MDRSTSLVLLTVIALLYILYEKPLVNKEGIEQSSQRFMCPPELYLNITAIVRRRGGIDLKTSQRIAEDLLREEDFNCSFGPLVESAWYKAMVRTEYDDGSRALPQRFKKDPVKVAAHVYSMVTSSFDGKLVYEEFDDVTWKHQSSNSGYESYPFKGLYALLLLKMRSFPYELYRGVNYIVSVEKGAYIRFNRFLSTTVKKEVAEDILAGPDGTLIIIKGNKMAFDISPYSQLEFEHQYLIRPDTQFRVRDVDKSTRPRVITLLALQYKQEQCPQIPDPTYHDEF